MKAPRFTKDEAMAEAANLYAKLAANYAVTDVYPYRHADSSDAFMRVRFDLKPEARARNPGLRDKEIRALHWNGEKYAHGEGEKRIEGKPLYRLPELLRALRDDASRPVWIVEGEKCVEALRALGLVATTSGGAKSDDTADWTPLRGSNVRTWPDNDEPGAKYADAVETHLRALGCAAPRIDVTNLELPDKGDCVDWLREHPDATADDVLALPMVKRTTAQATQRTEDDGSARVILTRASDVESKPIDWLWHGWLAAGKMHLIGGQPGTGKTTIASALAAVVSRGGRWPDGSRAASGSVVIWSGEDDAEDTLKPRMQAAGADCDRIYFLSGIREKGEQHPFDPASDAPMLVEALAGIPYVRLLIVDPIVSAVAGDSHKNAEVRRGLQPLVDLAQARRIALLGVTHFSKGTAGRDPVERITGSLAFAAMTRVVMVTAKQEADGDRPERRVLMRAKSNIGPDGGGFVYDLEQGPLEDDPGIEASRVKWGEPLEGSARELLAEAEERNEDARDDAPGFLRELLSGYGSRPAKDIFREAESAGFSRDAMKRAKRKVGVVAVKAGMLGGWEWRLPKSEESGVTPEGSEECTQNCPLPSLPSEGPEPVVEGEEDEGVII